MSTDESKDKDKKEKDERAGSETAGGREKKAARRLTFHLFGADKSGDSVLVDRASNTTEKDLGQAKGDEASHSSKRGAGKEITIEELKLLAEGSEADARFAQDLLTNVHHWQLMPEGPERDAYAKKQQVTAMGMLGKSITELIPNEKSSGNVSGEASHLFSNLETSGSAGAAGSAESAESAEQSAGAILSVDISPQKEPPVPGPGQAKAGIVETRAVFLETADLRALREEDLAMGRKGGPAEQFLGLLDNFRKVLKPGKEQDAAVRRVKRMAISLLSGRLQELQNKKGTTGDADSQSQFASATDADKKFILELKEKARGETAQHKIPAQFYERRQTISEWAKELEDHIAKLNELNKSVDITERQSQPVGLNAALNRGASNAKAVLHAETEIRKALAMMPEKEIKDLQSNPEYKQIVSDLLYSANISSATRQAARVFLTPGWQKSPESVRQLAQIAIKGDSFELLKSTFRYCTADVRQAFRQMPEAQETQKVFSMYGKHLNEVLQYGRESLTTQLGTAEGFAFGWFGLANKDEIKKFVDKASSEDRHRYLLGEKLAGRSELDAEEKQAVSFYKEVDAALRAATNPVINAKQYDLLRNKLVGGEEIYAALRELHKDEYFGLLRSNDMKGMRRAVELLSLKDWTSLRESPARFCDLEQSLRKFLNPQEHKEIIGMLRAKIGEKGKDNLTFEESQKRGRVPIEIALLGSDPERWNAVWTAQNTNQLEKLQTILDMSQLEINSYLKDKGNPRYLDTLVEAQLTGPTRLVAERTLRQALLTGRLETDDISSAIISKLSNLPIAEQLHRFEAILARPGVMARLKSPQDPETKTLRAVLDQMVHDFVEATEKLDLKIGKSNKPDPAEYSRRIFENGVIPIDLKLLLSKNSSLSLNDLFKLSADERQALTADERSGGNKFLQSKVFKSLEQQEFASRLLSSGRKEPTESDRLRAAVLGLSEDRGRLILRLSALNANELNKSARLYSQEYNSSLPIDLFTSSTGRQRTQVRELFSDEMSRNLGQGAHKALDSLAEFCRVQRAALGEFADEEQELLEEICFNYALCREMNLLSISSGFSKLTATVPLREAIDMLQILLNDGQASPRPAAGSPQISSKPATNTKLSLVKEIMGSDFDHSLLSESTGRQPNQLQLRTLQECIMSNLTCLRIQEKALDTFEEVRAKRFLQMIDVLQKRIAEINARISFWREFEILFGNDNKPQAAGFKTASGLSDSDRFWLAEQVICECAFPHNVKPGIGNDTNTITIACNLLCDNKPATFARMIASAVVFDRVETVDGTVIQPSQFGAFLDDLDIIELRKRPCAADYSDLVGTASRPARNLVGKIAQTILANVYWKRNGASISVVEEKGKLRLARADEDNVQATLFNVGEVCFMSTEFGHELRVVRGDRQLILHEYMNDRTPILVPSRSPRIEPDFLPDIYNQVVVNQRFEPAKIKSQDNEATHVI